MIQKKTVIVDGQAREMVWQVDSSAVRTVRGNDWLERFPQLLMQDIQEMEQSFPRWILVAGNGANPVACPSDGEYITLKDGQLRCVQCGEVYQGQVGSLIWTGLLPVQVTGAERVENLVRRKIAAGSLQIGCLDQANALFLFAPIKVVYPTNWPNNAPEAFYIKGFFEALDVRVSGASHSYHMLSDSKICMFAQWHNMSIREVIQNRIAPHALAIVTIANGERPRKWFN